MRPSLSLLLASTLALGCGSAELDQLEKEQSDLRRQVEDLRGQVGTLTGEMVDAGLISPKQAKQLAKADAPAGKGGAPAGKGGKGEDGAKGGKAHGRRGGRPESDFGNPLPDNELGSALKVTAARTGTPPTLPAPADVERLESACGHKFVLRDLQPLSDYPLNSTGFGKSGPVLMLENGQPMKSHALPEDFEAQCAGAFRHAGYAFFFSPSGSPEAATTNTYTLALAPEVPLPRGDDGREMYWVYPGTTLTLSIDGGWDASWGDMKVAVGGRLATGSESPAKVRFLGKELTPPANGKPVNFGFQETIEEPPTGPWKIVIESPEDGPYVLLGTVTVGNDDNALVITSEEAFTAAHGGE